MVRRLGTLAVSALVIASVPAVPARAASGPRAVGVHTVSFVDKTRTTPADVVAGITPEPQRRLPTTIFYPAKGANGRAAADDATRDAPPRSGPFPVVLFAGGAPGTPSDYAPLLRSWAAAGYVVVAPQFPVSSYAGPDDVAYTDLPRQSGDLRFVLRRVLALKAKKTGIPAIDEQRIAVSGHSLGAQTALSLMAKCCRESRVDAALVLAAVTDAPDGPALRNVRGPVLFVHARNDRAVAYGPTRAACAAVAGWKRMLTIEEIRGVGAHVEPYVGDGEHAAIARPATIDYLDGYVRDDAGARRRLARAAERTDLADLSRCRAGAG